METGGHRFIALPLDAGLICLVVSISFLSLSHPGPQPPPACELPLQDLGKLLCSGRCRPQPIGGASARPYETAPTSPVFNLLFKDLESFGMKRSICQRKTFFHIL